MPSAELRPPVGRLSASDVVFAIVVLGFTALAARVWWLSAVVPGQDYPQFLVFVRAVQDLGDPASPFHGTYVTGPWFIPSALPIHLTVLLSRLCGGSIEVAGRLLLTGQNVGLVAASSYLLHVLGRSRWAIVLLFPLIHSAWTVVGGFVLYATALPFVLLGWALTVRWLTRSDLLSGVALALTLCLTLAWHGIAYAQLGLGFAVLWVLWRAPSPRAQLWSAVPAVPSLLQFAGWTLGQLGATADRGHASWAAPWTAARSAVDVIWASVPHATARALLLAALVGVGLLMGAERSPVTSRWRVRNPFLIVAAAFVVAYFVLPLNLNRVEGVSNRFAYLAALAFVFAWNLPAVAVRRVILISAVLAFSAWSLLDLSQRFRAFDAETRGASALLDRLSPHDTLYFWPARRGYSEAFGAPGNKAMIELEQFATVRWGGLPSSSFAGYGMGYVRYVDDRNPMPGLRGTPQYGPQLARFDYVLSRGGQVRPDEHLRLVGSQDGWELYGVCGSSRFPSCGSGDALPAHVSHE